MEGHLSLTKQLDILNVQSREVPNSFTEPLNPMVCNQLKQQLLYSLKDSHEY
jgi:hypothetical protein